VTSETLNVPASFEEELEGAVRLLREGGVAAIPTDTLYGLAADAFNSNAIEQVFAIKERPEGMALPVLLSATEQLSIVALKAPEAAHLLAEVYWPGPLTLIVRKVEGLPPRLTAGQATVAVRVPAHPVPRELARRLGRPITGTSANISGAPDPQTLDELRLQVGERVDCVVSAGTAPAGTASTIVDLTGDVPRLIREGAIPFAEIAALLNTD
jgi:L-threonylcarbamoyladenylate synthase